MSVVRTLIGNVKGPKGDTGSQGPQGVAGTIEIGSVQTVGYGSPASVKNSGTDTEAVLDFQIPQGAPGETVSDMSNLTLQTITDSTADYPTFAVGETGASIFGKIRKFLSDLKNNYVSKSMMTISTDISTEGQAVADAKAIKSLNDALATTNSNVSSLNDSLAKFKLTTITLPSAVSIAHGTSEQLLNNFDISSYIDNGTLLGFMFMWCNGAGCAAVDQYFSNNKISLVVWNVSSVNLSPTQTRLLLIYK